MPALLLSGERSNLTVVEFDTDSHKLAVTAEYPAPFNVSWTEPLPSEEKLDHLVGLSEGEESGLIFTFDIDHGINTCEITRQQETLGAPAHLQLLYDQSAFAVGTYMGGSIALYPTTKSKAETIVLANEARAEINPPFPYAAQGHGKNPNRQRQCHLHHVLEDKTSGLLYATDLGSDRVWILERRPELRVSGWLQCPHGTGPRHSVMNSEGTILYVIGELSHTVLAFDLKTSAQIKAFDPNVISPLIAPNHQSMMDAAELSLHPTIPNVLYVSNRWVRHIAEREPHLTDVPGDSPLGDDVAIILLSPDGRAVEAIKHVQTGLDVIRGMRLSPDGRFAALVGQEGGGLEIFEISGDRADAWRHVTSLREGMEGGLKHVVWL